MLRKFYSHGARALGLSFIQELVSRFRHCPKCVGRQAFACICQVSTDTENLPLAFFVLGEAGITFTESAAVRGSVCLASHPRHSLHPRHGRYPLCAGHPGVETGEEAASSHQTQPTPGTLHPGLGCRNPFSGPRLKICVTLSRQQRPLSSTSETGVREFIWNANCLDTSGSPVRPAAWGPWWDPMARLFTSKDNCFR